MQKSAIFALAILWPTNFALVDCTFESAAPVVLPSGTALNNILKRSDPIWKCESNSLRLCPHAHLILFRTYNVKSNALLLALTGNISDSSSYPSLWHEAPFVGNGMVGAYLMSTSKSVTIEISRADFWDVRLPGTEFYSGLYFLILQSIVEFSKSYMYLFVR